MKITVNNAKQKWQTGRFFLIPLDLQKGQEMDHCVYSWTKLLIGCWPVYVDTGILTGWSLDWLYGILAWSLDKILVGKLSESDKLNFSWRGSHCCRCKFSCNLPCIRSLGFYIYVMFGYSCMRKKNYLRSHFAIKVVGSNVPGSVI